MSVITYTLNKPSAMYRYISGSGRAEIVFKDRNRIISYPLNSERGLRLASRLVLVGDLHISVPKVKNKNASTN